MSIVVQIPIKGIENFKQVDKNKDYSLGTEGVIEITLSEDTNIYFTKKEIVKGTNIGSTIWLPYKEVVYAVEEYARNNYWNGKSDVVFSKPVT